jgi:hypothetical protein
MVAATILLGGCAQSAFDTVSDPATVERALASAGVEVCDEGDLAWGEVPGFVSGRSYVLDTDCSTADPNKPGAIVTVARFDSVGARDAAQARFLTQYRRGASSGAARTLGPLLITIDGNQRETTIERVKEALETVGAQ